MENNKRLADLRYKRDFYLKYKENGELIAIANAIISIADKYSELTEVDQRLTEWAKEYIHSNGPLANLQKERDACLANSENEALQEKELQSIANAILFTAVTQRDIISSADQELINWAKRYVHSISSLANLRMDRDLQLANPANERLQYKELSSIAKSILYVSKGIPAEKLSEEDLKLVNWAKGFSHSPDLT